MAKKAKPPEKVVGKNIQLTGKIVRYLLKNQQIFNSLPDNFELVILPDDDPEMRLYNLSLLDKYGSEGKPVVFAGSKMHNKSVRAKAGYSFFVPLPMPA